MSRLAFLNSLATYEMVPGNRPIKNTKLYQASDSVVYKWKFQREDAILLLEI